MKKQLLGQWAQMCFVDQTEQTEQEAILMDVGDVSVVIVVIVVVVVAVFQLLFSQSPDGRTGRRTATLSFTEDGTSATCKFLINLQ